jgi:hypothetical protein
MPRSLVETQRERRVQHTHDVHMLEHDMDMGIDQAGHDRPAVGVDLGRAVGTAQPPGTVDGHNPIVFDQHRAAGEGQAAGAIDHRAVVDECACHRSNPFTRIQNEE